MRKARFASEEAALAAVVESGLALRAYRCDRGDRGGHFHLTSRTKGKLTPRPYNPLRIDIWQSYGNCNPILSEARHPALEGHAP